MVDNELSVAPPRKVGRPDGDIHAYVVSSPITCVRANAPRVVGTLAEAFGLWGSGLDLENESRRNGSLVT